MLRSFLSTFVVLLLGIGAAVADAQTGVSDDRVSLPEGPGSLEGVGENVEPNPSHGSMSYGIPIDVTEGYAGVSPTLRLAYNSGGGNSIAGMGWSMDLPCVERMTFRGLPRYDRDDDFAANGGSELVHLPGTDPPVYRARYEGSFVRYTWMADTQGHDGYWIAEYPDGRKAWFGATADGTTMPEARVARAGLGTFRYELVEMVDLYGHRIRYTWTRSGDWPLVSHIGYVFEDDTPLYEVDFEYEERRDAGGLDYHSDAAPRFDLRLTQRLAAVDVISVGTRIRRYELSYLPYAESGGYTLLARVQMRGETGEVFPIAFDMTYTRSLVDVCDAQTCGQPRTVSMGSIGAGIESGAATLININGDALPDLVNTQGDGPHRFQINRYLGPNAHSFGPEQVSTVGSGLDHNLTAGNVQVLDANGDGFTDMLNTRNGLALVNGGGGDWAEEHALFAQADSALPDLATDLDPDDGDLETIRFLDYDNDKMIDVMRSTVDQTLIYRNTGRGFVVADGVMDIGVGFETNDLDLTDMNGDGLLDPVQIFPDGRLRYRLNLGFGQWADWIEIPDLPWQPEERDRVQLEDLNNDGVTDIVLVLADEVRYALNKNGDTFTAPVTLRSADIDGTLPQRDDRTSVLFADMDGNGSTDILWIDGQGQATYLELFPIPPNLLYRIENGLGQVTEVTWTSSVDMMARDGGVGSWANPLPHPMTIVDTIDTWDRWSDIHQVTHYRYHDGFYDGDEKLFRGFERVETEAVGDDAHESGRVLHQYDVGKTDPYHNGLLVSTRVFSDERELSVLTTRYGDCPLDGIPGGTTHPIRFVCELGTQTVVKEGLPEDRWVTTESSNTYDGYGNVTLTARQGVTDVGGQPCEPCAGRTEDDFGAPCGSTCQGDERFIETSYIEPGPDTGGRWILGKPYRERLYGRPGSDLYTETLTYYDGPAFEGLPLGTLHKGEITREMQRIDGDRYRATTRFRRDAHGNVVETLDALAGLDGQTHRRLYTLDPMGLDVLRTEILLETDDGTPYRLRQEYSYEPLYGHVTEVTAFMMVDEGGQVLTGRDSQTYLYDDFGRPAGRILPGDDALHPTERYTYELGSPTSRIVIQQRASRNGELDHELVTCLDGRGRQIAQRQRLDDGSWQVTDATLFDTRSMAVRVYQPYLSASDDCNEPIPDGVRYTSQRYDANGRLLQTIAPDADDYGTPSTNRTVYEPLRVISYDAEDTDPESPYVDTPGVAVSNGVGDVVANSRQLAGGQLAEQHLHYDGLGHLVAVEDAVGNLKRQSWDLLSRVTAITDPNTADVERFVYDDAGNLVAHTDPRGVTHEARYDGANRRTARWDVDDPEATMMRWTYDFAPEGCAALDCSTPQGMLTSVSVPDDRGGQIVRHMGYDVRRRSTYLAVILDGHLFPFRTSYDNLNQATHSAWPDGRTLDVRWDRASRRATVDGIIDSITYDDRSNMESLDFSDGTRCTMRYDARMRLDQLLVEGPDGQPIQGLALTLDRMGNIDAIDDLASPRAGHPTFDLSLTHDAWYRLSELTWGDGADAETLSFGFDAIDNVLSISSSLGAASPAHQGALAYDGPGPNAVSRVGGVERSYDAEGNVTAIGDMALGWDDLDRLTTVTRAGQPLASFAYDDETTRMIKREGESTTYYPLPDFVVRDGVASLYVRVGDKRVARLDSAALAPSILSDIAPIGAPDQEINAADAWLAFAASEGLRQIDGEADAPGALLLSSLRRLLVETGPDDGTAFLHHDQLGSATLATGQVGGETRVLGERSYYPTGTLRQSSGWVDDFDFSGKERDPSTGLLYFGARYLDPAAARWISRDPAFSQLSTQTIGRWGEALTGYGYVANGFASTVDEAGLDGEKVVFAIDDQPDGPISRGLASYKSSGYKLSKTLVSYKGWGKVPAEISVISHGHLGKGLGADDEAPITPKQLVKMLKGAGLKPGHYEGLQLHIRACNSGSSTFADYPDDDPSSVGTGELVPPYAERLARELATQGYGGIDVIGYAGFYLATTDQVYEGWGKPTELGRQLEQEGETKGLGGGLSAKNRWVKYSIGKKPGWFSRLKTKITPSGHLGRAVIRTGSGDKYAVISERKARSLKSPGH